MKNIVLGLFLLMIADIILSLTLKTFLEDFSFKALLKIVFKSFVILSSSILIYYAGYLNPEIFVVNIGGVNMNLNDSLRMIYILAIMFYGFTSIKKLASLLNVDESISPSEENVDEIIEDEIDEEITDEPGDTGETTNEPESDIKNDDEDCIEKYKSAKGDAMG